MEDEGNYRCMVDNQHTDATLTVERKLFFFNDYLEEFVFNV